MHFTTSVVAAVAAFAATASADSHKLVPSRHFHHRRTGYPPYIPTAVTNAVPKVASPAQAPASAAKRGIAFTPDDTQCAASMGGGKASWCYDWGSMPRSGCPQGVEYVPMLHDCAASLQWWGANAPAMIAKGAKHILGMNEPDIDNIPPSQSAQDYMTHITPYAGKVKLGSPSVSNAGGSQGLAWLSSFLNACQGCKIDFLQVHWYGYRPDAQTNFQEFVIHMNKAISMAGGKPLWLTEFQTKSASQDEAAKFMKMAIDWLEHPDRHGKVERYSWYMASRGGSGPLLTNSDCSANSLGQLYKTH